MPRLFLSRPTWSIALAAACGVALSFPIPGIGRVWADEDETESRDEDKDDDGDEKEEEGEDREDAEFAEKDDEGEEDNEGRDEEMSENESDERPDGEDGEHHDESEHHEESLAGRLTRVKELIAEGKLDDAQELLDQAISQAQEIGRHDHEEGDGEGDQPVVVDVEKLRSAIDDLRSRLGDTLKPAREALSVVEEVEKAHEALDAALDERKVQSKYAAAVKDAKAKIRDIIAEAKKSPDLAKVFRRGEVGNRLDELFAGLSQIREIDATIEEIQRSVDENLADASWRNQWEERLEAAESGLAEHLSEEAAGDWNDGRLEAIGGMGNLGEVVSEIGDRLSGVFHPDLAGQVSEAATRSRENIESVFADRDPAADWEQALSQAAADQPDNAVLRTNEHPARLRTVLADLKSNLLALHDAEAVDASLRMAVGDLTRGLREKLAGANTDEAWSTAIQEFERRLETLRNEAEEARQRAEQEAEANARMEEEQAEAAEAARRLAEEQAEGDESKEEMESNEEESDESESESKEAEVESEDKESDAEAKTESEEPAGDDDNG